MNRLQNESSPYLKQHQNNPVDWYPWGDEAFAEAARRDVPIFLSIGYSTCHWCHVMEHESFEDEGIAAYLKEHFVAIKVDREERPDIDHIYMRACQAMTGQGGWPLTILMHADKQPFYAGTYLPKNAVQGRIGLTELLASVMRVWNTQRHDLTDAAREIVQAISEEKTPTKGDMSPTLTRLAFERFRERFDARHGGFGNTPKFPSFHNLIFLTRCAEAEALAMAEKTLHEIIAGGITDQIGFGIHRYSTDTAWHLPHFEKMLYDQAMFMLALAEIYAKTHKPIYRAALLRTFEFVERELKNRAGGYFTAYDADSEGEEGKFYTFTYHQLRDLLDDADLAFVVRHLAVRERGNFTDEATREPSPANIFHWAEDPTGGVTPDWQAENDFATFEPIRQKIFTERAKRIHPGLDNKILTDLNGLYLAALARTAFALGDGNILNAAHNQFTFVQTRILEGGKLFHSPGTQQNIPGNLDDYAFVIWGLLEYYQSTRVDGALLSATALIKTVLSDFSSGDGGFYFTEENTTKGELIARTREFFDGAIPSGNSVMAANLSRLYQLTADLEFRGAHDSLMALYAGFAQSAPTACSHALGTYVASGTAMELVVQHGDATLTEMLRELYIPGIAIIEASDALADRFAYLKNYKAERETYWLCRNFSCQLPVHSLAELKEQLNQQKQNH